MAPRISFHCWCSGAIVIGCAAQAVPPRLLPAEGGRWPRTPHTTSVQAVEVSGGLAYVGVDQGLRVVDVSDPAHPVEVGLYSSPGHYAHLVRVRGNYAYRAYLTDDDSGLEVLDLSNTARPKRIGSVSFPDTDSPRALEVNGNHAYVVSDNSGLRIIDVSDPTRPALVATYDSLRASGISVQAGYAFLMGYRRLFVMEMQNATNLVTVGIYTNADVGSIQVRGQHAYMAAGSQRGLQVVDVSNPTQPVMVGTCCTDGGASQIEVEGRYAYLSGPGVRVVDISDPAHPMQVGQFGDVQTGSMDLAGHHLYLANGTLQILDVSVPVAPVRSGVFDIRGRALDLRVSGHHAYVADAVAGLRVIDVSRSANPVLVGHGFTNGGARTLDLQGGYAYVGGYNGGTGRLEVIDIEDPANPRTVGSLTTAAAVEDVAVQGRHAYVTMGWRGGMMVVDVSNPARPEPIFGMSGGRADSVQVAGDYLYLDRGGLEILDIRDPGNPIQVSWIRDGIYDFFVSGQFAYIVADPEGSFSFQIIDVSNPAGPVKVAETNTLGYPGSIHVSGHLAYVTFLHDDGPVGWAVHDVSDPARPRLVHVETDPNPREFRVSEGLLYAAQDLAGLGIITSIRGVQFSFQIDGTAGVPFTIETASDFSHPQPWTPLATHTPSSLPFHFMDTSLDGRPRRFYRVRQP